MLKKIKPDKWKHFFVGMAMGAGLELLVVRMFPGWLAIGSVIVFIIIALISYGFELISLVLKRGHYDISDAVASVLGGVLGMGILLLAI